MLGKSQIRKSSTVLLVPYLALLTSLLIPNAVSGQSWLEVRSPHFLITTDIPEDSARGIVYELEQLYNVLPPSARNALLLSIFYFRDSAAVARYAAEPSVQKDGFLREVGTAGSAVAVVSSMRGLFHEYAHFATSSAGCAPWASEGLADFYSLAKIANSRTGPTMVLGMPYTEALQILQRRPPIPIQQLISAGRDSAFYNDIQQREIFYAEAWALAHLLITQGLPLSTCSVNACAVTDAQLAEHIIAAGTVNSQSIHLSDIDMSRVRMRNLSDAEIALRLAELRTGEARLAELKATVAQYSEYAPSWDSLGLALLKDHRAEALDAFDRAIELGTSSAQSRYLAGLIRLHDGGNDGGNVEEGERLLYAAAAMEPANQQYRSAWETARQMREEREEKAILALVLSVHSNFRPMMRQTPQVRIADPVVLAARASTSKRAPRAPATPWLFGSAKLIGCSGPPSQRVCQYSR